MLQSQSLEDFARGKNNAIASFISTRDQEVYDQFEGGGWFDIIGNGPDDQTRAFKGEDELSANAILSVNKTT